MALTKALASVDEWASITAATQREGAAIDVSALFSATLHIVIAHIEAVAHANGVLVTIQTRAGANDEDWRDLVSFRTAGGTANTIDVDATSAAAQTQLKVSATANFETMGDKYFVKDATIANSEIVQNNGFVSNDYITCLDNLTLEHLNTGDVYDIVEEFTVAVPFPASTVRVIYWNDDADCDVVSKCDIEKVTAIS